MPVASIIIPTWNSSRTIIECIQSVKNQTLQDFECIIIDDGSEDDTVQKIVETISEDNKFKLIKQPHLGLSIVRNLGIETATSDIIFHLDSDDLAKPNMIKSATKFLLDNNLDIAVFNAEVINYGENSRIFKDEQRHFIRKKHYGIMSGLEFFKAIVNNDDFVYATFIQASRKSKIRYKFFPDLRIEDELCTIENLLLADRVGHLNETLYTKRCIPFSVSKQRKDIRYIWSKLKVAQELIAFADKENINDIKALLYIIKHLIEQVVTTKYSLQQNDIKWINKLSLTDKVYLDLFTNCLKYKD